MILVARQAPLVAFSGVVLGALAGASLRSLHATLTGDLAEASQRGQAIGLLNISAQLGAAAGPVVAYALLPLFGLSGIYLACAGLYALGIALALWGWMR